MKALGITTSDMLRQVDHRAVIAWNELCARSKGPLPRQCAVASPRCRACSSYCAKLRREPIRIGDLVRLLQEGASV
jgi:hypothetical protein